MIPVKDSAYRKANVLMERMLHWMATEAGLEFEELCVDFIDEDEHVECQHKATFYAMRLGPAESRSACRVQLQGPPNCCRLRKDDQEFLYLSCDTRLEEGRPAFNMHLHVEEGLPPM